MCECVADTVQRCEVKPTKYRDELLLCFMYYICTGHNASYLHCEEGETTQLEKAASVLRSLEPLCTDDITQLASTVASLIKRQVTIHLMIAARLLHYSTVDN